MAIEHKLIKCENPDDPKRCQGTVRGQQCPWQAIEDTPYCKMHQGGTKAAAAPDRVLRNYRLAKWQVRVNEFADNPQVKSLREEIGILRMILEEVLCRCEDANDLLIYSNKISDYVQKIEKIISSCHRLEQSSGFLLDKTAILQIANTIIEIVSTRVDDPILLNQISEEIIQTITASQSIKDRVTPKEQNNHS